MMRSGTESGKSLKSKKKCGNEQRLIKVYQIVEHKTWCQEFKKQHHHLTICKKKPPTNQPLLPAGLLVPKLLKVDWNLVTNWKKFKHVWNNYAIAA